MDETPRESSLAAILARGLFRVRQRVERAGNRQALDSDADAAKANSVVASKTTNGTAECCKQGEQE